MDDLIIKAVVEEIIPSLTNRVMGKVFLLSRESIAIDFRGQGNRYLFISVEPSRPRLYMIVRRVRDLEKQSLAPSPFVLVLRKYLGGARALGVEKDAGDRIVRFFFAAPDAAGDAQNRTLIVQLTGRAANLLLVDDRDHVIDMLRRPRGEGQEIGSEYRPPPANVNPAPVHKPFDHGNFDSLSEALDAYHLGLEAKRAFEARAAQARARLRKEIAQRAKLRRHLERDLALHGDAEEHKRIGDLLLANTGTAERRGNVVTLTDYYAEGAPRISVEVDEHSSLQKEAARRFSRYSKAKRAAQEIARRNDEVGAELEALRARQEELEEVIAAGDEAALGAFIDDPQKLTRRAAIKRKSAEGVPGARRYRSSDGYEILVGRAARDNDHLTFRVARPHDLWLHAADYPGSHVIVRNPSRAEIPQRTVIEAAQLAAHFSHARGDAKVDVHYTPRKFLSKPKGAAPGLVRLSAFRTITAEPRVSVERI